MKVNKNYYFCTAFVDELIKCGVKYVCISPGSRNTPLVTAFAERKEIEKFVIIDERASAFFALGLAKATGIPAAIVTTSGTAVVELYPAIVEAYQQRVPMIICTADRPENLRNSGANQTINQENIYKNHIRQYFAAKIPSADYESLFDARIKAFESFVISKSDIPGPVHINFPFEKPLEKHLFTDEVSYDLFERSSLSKHSQQLVLQKYSAHPRDKNKIFNQIDNSRLLIDKEIVIFRDILYRLRHGAKTIIIAGTLNIAPEILKYLVDFAKIIRSPLFSDIASNLRFLECGVATDSVLVNYDAFLRNSNFLLKDQPSMILQFGQPFISQGLDDYLSHCSATRYLINEWGDWVDPLKKAKGIIRSSYSDFCDIIIEELNRTDYFNHPEMTANAEKWESHFFQAEELCESIKREFLNQEKISIEPSLVNTILESLPSGVNIMLSNSTVVRDFDWFASKDHEKTIRVFTNRGASGIDGIVATTLGIKKTLAEPLVLIIGDLALFYDITTLTVAKKYDISVLIILVNNNGGGIFHALPVANEPEIFEEYFKTPINFEFSKFVHAMDLNFFEAQNYTELTGLISTLYDANGVNIIEIKTSAHESFEFRRVYRDIIKSAIDNSLSS